MTKASQTSPTQNLISDSALFIIVIYTNSFVQVFTINGVELVDMNCPRVFASLVIQT